jgi:hypothetical protein
MGFQALQNNTTSDNTAMGFQALGLNTTGIQNTAMGGFALPANTDGQFNTVIGHNALSNNSQGDGNTGVGWSALSSNATGSNNTAVGFNSNVFAGLVNATAIGANAVANASNKIRLGDGAVTVVEGQVAYTFSSDANKKERFRLMDGEEVLRKFRGLSLTSWNYIGHDPEKFRHYGPMAQEFFAAFGHDGIGTIGTPTTINSGDIAGILMVAVQALEKRTAELKEKEAQLVALQSEVNDLKAKHAYFETVAARLEALELRQNHPMQIAETSVSVQ